MVNPVLGIELVLVRTWWVLVVVNFVIGVTAVKVLSSSVVSVGWNDWESWGTGAASWRCRLGSR